MASKQYLAGEWANMGLVGYTRAEDEGVWARMVGGDWEGEEEVQEVKEDNPPPPRLKHHPLNPEPPKLVARKFRECILSRMTHQTGPSPPPKRKLPPPPKTTPPPNLESGIWLTRPRLWHTQRGARKFGPPNRQGAAYSVPLGSKRAEGGGTLCQGDLRRPCFCWGGGSCERGRGGVHAGEEWWGGRWGRVVEANLGVEASGWAAGAGGQGKAHRGPRSAIAARLAPTCFPKVKGVCLLLLSGGGSVSYVPFCGCLGAKGAFGLVVPRKFMRSRGAVCSA